MRLRIESSHGKWQLRRAVSPTMVVCRSGTWISLWLHLSTYGQTPLHDIRANCRSSMIDFFVHYQCLESFSSIGLMFLQRVLSQSAAIGEKFSPLRLGLDVTSPFMNDLPKIGVSRQLGRPAVERLSNSQRGQEAGPHR